MSTRPSGYGAGPQAEPETPHKRGNGEAINKLVRKLRDELRLAIAPREHTYSPSQHNNTTGDILYDRIQFLCFKDPDAIDPIIKACSSEFNLASRHLSVDERTTFAFSKVEDAYSEAKARIHQSSRRVNTSLSKHKRSSARPERRSLRRVDSRADTDAPNTPGSPLARKSLANTGETTPTMNRDNSRSGSSFASHGDTPSTSFEGGVVEDAGDEVYGSSFTLSQVEGPRTGLHSKALDLHVQRSIPPISAAKAAQYPTKRRRFDGFEDVTETPPKKARWEPQHDPTSPQHEQGDGGRHKSKICQHQITALVGSRFGAEQPYVFDDTLPYAASVERARLMKHTAKSYEQVSTVTDHDGAKALLVTSHSSVQFPHSSPAIWTLPKTLCPIEAEDSKLFLSGTISLSNDHEDVDMFKLTMQPIRRQSKSNHLERHFGFDRILSITFPSFTQGLPDHLKGHHEAIFSSFHDWIHEPKQLFGRTWHVFHLDEIEKKVGGKRVTDVTRAHEVLFFATSGDGIEKPISYFEFLDCMTPFEENAGQPVCKLFARHDLYLSRTTPTVQFCYSQIRFVDDILANGEPEDTEHEDPTFAGKRRKAFSRDEVMTDGCAMISAGAAQQVCEKLGIAERPTTFQARINGHKGIWYISDSYDTEDAEHLDVWIELRPSQAKVKIRPQDRDESQCEPDRWSFNVVEHTRPPKFSDVHKDFFQLLEDRHAPREDLLAIVKERTDESLKVWSTAMENPASFAVLRERLYGGFEDNRKSFEHGLPHTAPAKTELFMDEAGYQVKECAILADAAMKMQDRDLQQLRSKLRFPCKQTTYVVGIADPYGVLKPGEVQLVLKKPLVDRDTREAFDSSANRNILVARHPSLRDSDMQKVKNRPHPRLSHLTDVIVMSTRGQIPLAAKLQGGDYDGDKFWICADDRLERPFLNAPVLEQHGIDQLDIKQETRRLMDIVDDSKLRTDEHARAWMRIALPFSHRGNQLGSVTNYLYKLAYYRNDLGDPGVRLIADVHDQIIDTAKNGYEFDAQDFKDFRNKHKDLFPEAIGKPRWSENTDCVEFKLDDDNSSKLSLRDLVKPIATKDFDNILDDMIFNEINPKINAHLKNMYLRYVNPAHNVGDDVDLQFVLQQVPPRLVAIEKRAMISQLDKPLQKWAGIWSPSSPETRTRLLRESIDLYNLIRPTGPDSDYWNMCHGPGGPTTWDCFKVGVLASSTHKKKRRFMFWVARDTVCYLKSMSLSGKNTIASIKAVKKARQPKDWTLLDAANDLTARDEGEADDDGEYGGDDDLMFDFDPAAFDALDQ